MTTPAAHKTPEDQRRQNCQTKKDKARIDEAALQRLHRLRGLDGRNGFAHDPPLNDVRDHEQVEGDQRRRAPPARFRFANTGFLDWRVFSGSCRTSSSGNRPRRFQFPADATTLHKNCRIYAKTRCAPMMAGNHKWTRIDTNNWCSLVFIRGYFLPCKREY